MAKWINVNDRLPEPFQNVLVCAENKKNRGHRICAMTYMVNRYVSGQLTKRWRSPWACFCEMNEITHWMPLPELPELPKEDDADGETEESTPV